MENREWRSGFGIWSLGFGPWSFEFLIGHLSLVICHLSLVIFPSFSSRQIVLQYMLR